MVRPMFRGSRNTCACRRSGRLRSTPTVGHRPEDSDQSDEPVRAPHTAGCAPACFRVWHRVNGLTNRRPCCVMFEMSPARSPGSRCAAGVTLYRKGAKSRTPGRKPRSTGTKAKGRVNRSDESQASLIKKLKAHARDLEKKLETRTHDLAEALEHLTEAQEQQTGSSEVLRVISSSAGQLEPVFQAILEKAVRICDANFGVLIMFEAGGFHHVTLQGTTRAYADAIRREPVFYPRAGHPLDRLAENQARGSHCRHSG